MRRGAAALAVTLATASLAAAQPTQPAQARSVFISASAGLTRLDAPGQNSRCPPMGNLGAFCGQVDGMTPIIAGSAGVFLARHVGIGLEGSLSKGRTGSATYDVPSHTDYDVTTARFEHSAERSVSVLLRGRLPLGTRGAAIEPVIGATIAHATDRLTSQVRVSGPAGFPRTTTSRPDAATSYSPGGFVFGFDAASRSGRHLSFVGSARLRWLNWPQVMPNTYHPGSPQTAPASIGRWALVFSAGVRWLRARE